MTIFGVDGPTKPIVAASTAADDAVEDAYDAVAAVGPGFGDVLEAFGCCVRLEEPCFLVVVHFLDLEDQG